MKPSVSTLSQKGVVPRIQFYWFIYMNMNEWIKKTYLIWVLSHGNNYIHTVPKIIWISALKIEAVTNGTDTVQLYIIGFCAFDVTGYRFLCGDSQYFWDSARISDRIQRPADKSGVFNLQCPETNFTFSVSALNKRIQGGPNIVILET